MESTEKKFECRKCGMELHPDQKVCIRCGQPTPKGGGFDYGEEKEPWRPSPKFLGITGGVVALLLVLILVNVLRVDPPEKVAQEWMDALVQRKVGVAQKFITQDCQVDLETRFSDMRAVSDSYYTFVNENAGTFKVGKPKLNSQKKPTKADITINLKGSGNELPVQVEMVKVGRRWMINRIASSV